MLKTKAGGRDARVCGRASAGCRARSRRLRLLLARAEREIFIDNLLVRIYLIIKMIWWTGLAPWDSESPFAGSLISTFLVRDYVTKPDSRNTQPEN